MAEKFVADSLVPSAPDQTPSVSFYTPLTRSVVLTMSTMNKTVQVKGKSIIMDGERMYLRLLAVNGNKKVPLLRVMSFENAPVPLSIFKEDRTMIFAERKSDFVHKLEELVTEPKKISMLGVDAMILDGNAVIQALPPTAGNLSRTFKQMAEAFLNYVQHKSVSVKQVHVV